MKTKTCLLITAATVISLFLASSISADEPLTQRQHNNNRFRIASVHDTVILLDSATGDTWMLDDSRDGGKRQWLAITRQIAAVKPLSGKSVRAAQANPIVLAVEFAPEADAIIVRGTVNDIVKAIELLQGSDFAPRMTVNFFSDLDLGHIAVKGQRTDAQEIKRLVLTDKH